MQTIRIGGVPEHFNLPWHLAIEEGLFEKEGIQIEWIDFPDGTGAMNKALRAGSIDLAIILTGGIIKDIANGNPSKIIQLFVSSPLIWGVHVAAHSPIQHISELEHKKAAISRIGSGSYVMAYAQAEKHGWDTSKLQYEIIGTLEGAIEALTNDKADYFMWEHFTTKPIVDQGIFRRIGDFPTPWSCFVLAATNTLLENQPKITQKILKIINSVSTDFKNIPSIDRTLSIRYGQELEDIKKWLSLTQWSQKQISTDEINYIQERLLRLDMITNKQEIETYIHTFL